MIKMRRLKQDVLHDAHISFPCVVLPIRKSFRGPKGKTFRFRPIKGTPLIQANALIDLGVKEDWTMIRVPATVAPFLEKALDLLKGKRFHVKITEEKRP